MRGDCCQTFRLCRRAATSVGNDRHAIGGEQRRPSPACAIRCRRPAPVDDRARLGLSGATLFARVGGSASASFWRWRYSTSRMKPRTAWSGVSNDATRAADRMRRPAHRPPRRRPSSSAPAALAASPCRPAPRPRRGVAFGALTAVGQLERPAPRRRRIRQHRLERQGVARAVSVADDVHLVAVRPGPGQRLVQALDRLRRQLGQPATGIGHRVHRHHVEAAAIGDDRQDGR